MRDPQPQTGKPQDPAWRKCRHPLCRCPHIECADGWLDTEVTRVQNGQTYSQVVRCPVCAMAIPEPTPKRTRASRAQG